MKKITLLLAVLLTSLSYGQEKISNTGFEADLAYAIPAGWVRIGTKQLFVLTNAENTQASGSEAGSFRSIVLQKEKSESSIESTIGALETGNYTMGCNFKYTNTNWVGGTIKLFDGATELQVVAVDNTGVVLNAWNSFNVTFNVETALTNAKVEVRSKWNSGAGFMDNVSLFRNGAVLAVGNLEEFNFGFAPNPVTDNLNLSSAKNIQNIAVYNLMGQQVLNTVNPGNSIDVSNLEKGVYVLKATIEGKTGTYKFVKS